MICTCIQNKNFNQIKEILARPEVEMAEIRLDLCTLSDEEIRELFSESETPLVATCRGNERKLEIAIEAGAQYADLEIEAPAQESKRFQKCCLRYGTTIIRSYHNNECTPEDGVLQMALARCFRYGAQIAKIVTAFREESDVERLEGLYSVVLEGVSSMEGRLIAFAMGSGGRSTRMECLRRGAPFTYAALAEGEEVAPGQWTAAQMYRSLYGTRRPFVRTGLEMPASKSFAQRAIVAAALAEGTTRLDGFSPCADSEAAIDVARQLGATVERSGRALTIKGAGPMDKPLGLKKINTGESGLLTRLCIPLMAALNGESATVEGSGTLLKRPLEDAGGIMAAFGVLLSNEGEAGAASRELFVPLKVKGKLIPGTADVCGKGGSQLISGLLMTLPLCAKDSFLYVSEPRSIPYMYITLDVLRHFGIQTRSEMEGDAQMLEQQDWSYCSGVSFKIRGGQHYRAADFSIEGDWSAAANFLVAGAVFGNVEISGLDMKSLQADLTIIDILVEAGAIVSQVEGADGRDCIAVHKAPLDAFNTDLNHAPDLFPAVAVLAAFCAGESRISGVGRLSSKESDRGQAILSMLTQMGVEASICADDLVVCGESLSGRLLRGRLLKGGRYTSNHDHRMVMALKVASLGAESPVIIDDEACVGKSFPDFLKVFGQI